MLTEYDLFGKICYLLKEWKSGCEGKKLTVYHVQLCSYLSANLFQSVLSSTGMGHA